MACTPDPGNQVEYYGIPQKVTIINDQIHGHLVRVEWQQVKMKNLNDICSQAAPSKWLFVDNKYAPTLEMVGHCIKGQAKVLERRKMGKFVFVGTYILD